MRPSCIGTSRQFYSRQACSSVACGDFTHWYSRPSLYQLVRPGTEHCGEMFRTRNWSNRGLNPGRGARLYRLSSRDSKPFLKVIHGVSWAPQEQHSKMAQLKAHLPCIQTEGLVRFSVGTLTNRAYVFVVFFTPSGHILTAFGCAAAQAISREPPGVAVRVRAQIMLCEICGGHSRTGAGFLRFTLPTLFHIHNHNSGRLQCPI
jgi:hypothetical protein